MFNSHSKKEMERERKIKEINSRIFQNNKSVMMETERLHSEGMNRLKAFRLSIGR
jgi:hypothetical protein